MRMVRLPRRHKNSVPSWVDVTTFQSRAGRSAEGSVSNVASNTAALRSQAEFKPGRGVGEPFAAFLISNCRLPI